MGKVVSSASMSLDGFIATFDNTIGDLFDWYESGDLEVGTSVEEFVFHLTPQSAEYWRAWTGKLGVLVVGRELATTCWRTRRRSFEVTASPTWCSPCGRREAVSFSAGPVAGRTRLRRAPRWPTRSRRASLAAPVPW
jgi:hypothetical protein